MREVFKKVYFIVLKTIPFLKPIFFTRGTQTPITVKIWFFQKILGFNRKVYWPVDFTSTVRNYEKIYSGIDTSPGYSKGCYIQGAGGIIIGDYTQIGPQVGIISANHSVLDTREHMHHKIIIGKYCWIGMGSVILAGVTLGDHVVVGAGSIVTHSFSDGYCVIAGNPAKIIKQIGKNECKRYKNIYEYNGYIPHDKFEEYSKKKLKF